jgi:hypothetical protein
MKAYMFTAGILLLIASQMDVEYDHGIRMLTWRSPWFIAYAAFNSGDGIKGVAILKPNYETVAAKLWR